MRILMLYENTLDDLVNRDSRVQREAESLVKAGHDVNICLVLFHKDVTNKKIVRFGNSEITVYGGSSKIRPLPKNVGFNRKFALMTSRCIENLPVKLKKRLNLVGLNPRGLPSLQNLISIPADVYHAHDFSMLGYARFCSWFNRKPFIYDSHEYHAGTHGKKSKMVVRFTENIHLPKASAVITVTDSIAEAMGKNYNIPKPTVVHNFSKYREYAYSNKLRKKAGIDDNTPIVLYLGAVIRGRGTDTLISAAKQLPDVKFVFMGHGNIHEIKNHIIKNGIMNIIVLDPVASTEVVEWASSANIGISPIQNTKLSYYYSLPNKVGEYIMAGLPIAVSDFPEMRKLAVGEDLGVVFDPESPEDIARAIRELLEPETYARKKKNVMEARKRHCWENEEKKLLAIYKSIGGVT